MVGQMTGGHEKRKWAIHYGHTCNNGSGKLNAEGWALACPRTVSNFETKNHQVVVEKLEASRTAGGPAN